MRRQKTPDPGPGEWERPPAPYDHLIGIRAFSPSSGYGWLSYYQERRSTPIEFWFVSDHYPAPEFFVFVSEVDGRSSRIRHDMIYRVETQGSTWMLFHQWEPDAVAAFLLYPEESPRTHAVPPLIRRLLKA